MLIPKVATALFSLSQKMWFLRMTDLIKVAHCNIFFGVIFGSRKQRCSGDTVNKREITSPDLQLGKTPLAHG
jgi:hypothetical protein